MEKTSPPPPSSTPAPISLPSEPGKQIPPQQSEGMEKTNTVFNMIFQFPARIKASIKAFVTAHMLGHRGELSETEKAKELFLSQSIKASKKPVTRNQAQPRENALKFTSEQDIRGHMYDPDVNMFDLRAQVIGTKDPLWIARNALKKAFQHHLRNPKKALQEFEQDSSWKNVFPREQVAKVITDARSNPEFFQELAEQIESEKNLPPPPPKRKEATVPKPAIPRQQPEVQKSAAAPLEWEKPEVNIFTYFDEHRSFASPPFVNVAGRMLIENLDAHKPLSKADVQNIKDALEKEKFRGLSSDLLNKLLADAEKYVQKMIKQKGS